MKFSLGTIFLLSPPIMSLIEEIIFEEDLFVNKN